MEMNVEKKTKGVRISRQPFPVKTMIDQKQQENMESFKYLGGILTNDGRCTCEIKCRIALAKAAFNKKRALSLMSHRACRLTCYTIQLMHYSHFKTHSL
jgi:hypothetical protein